MYREGGFLGFVLFVSFRGRSCEGVVGGYVIGDIGGHDDDGGMVVLLVGAVT